MPVTSAIGNRGFTLLELLVALAILVLLVAASPFAAPRVFPAQQLRNEGQRLIAALRSTRMVARFTGAPKTIEFLQGGSSYRSQETARTMESGVRAQLYTDTPQARSDQLTFFPDGSSSGGRIDLALAGNSLSVRVGRFTGHAELVE
jgi:general secretion pathway protein H